MSPSLVQLKVRHLKMRVFRRFLAEKGLLRSADRSWEIAPAENRKLMPAIMLADQFDKIIKFEERTTQDIERVRALGGEAHFPALMAYEFNDAMLFDGAVVANNCEQRILPYELSLPRAEDYPVIDIEDGSIVSSYLGLQYFGHWLHSDMPLSLLAAQYGDSCYLEPPNTHPKKHQVSHHQDYLSLLDLQWRSGVNMTFRKLTLLGDELNVAPLAAARRELRGAVEKKLGPAKKQKRVFIRRGVSDHGSRNFVNEDAIADALEAEGFEIVHPPSLSAEEIQHAIYGANIVVSMEGSQTSHSIYFTQVGGLVIGITPPERYCSIYKPICDDFGYFYGIVVGDKVEDGFTANIDDIWRTIDLYEKQRTERRLEA